MKPKKIKRILKHNLPSKAGLIQDLLDLSYSLRRTPTLEDLRRAGVKGLTYHENVYVRVFGTFTNALRAARLPLNVKQEFTRQELLTQLRNLSKSLKRKLKSEDVVKASQNHTCARLATFVKTFGTLSKAFEEAGVGPFGRLDKNDMLQALRELTNKLGRLPTVADIDKASKKRKCPSYCSYEKHFGGLFPAIREAGLGNPQKSYTKQEMLKLLRDLADELGRPPLHPDITERSVKGLMPGTSSYNRHFGGIAKARSLAGIKSPRKSHQELLNDLRQLANRLGRTPLKREMKEAYQKGIINNPDMYWRVFGSLEEAREKAGLKPLERHPSRPTRSKKEVISQLQLLAKKLGHPPTMRELDTAQKRGECLSLSSLTRIFGSRAEAYRLAGIDTKQLNRKYGREELLDQLQSLAKKLGHTPKVTDIMEGSKQRKCASADVFRRMFGGFHKALKAAGLKPAEPKPRGHIKYTREQLIEDLRKLAQKLNRLPTEDDIKEASKRGECATSMVYAKRFGSIPEARREAGLGELVRSVYTRERLVKDLRKLSRKIKRQPVEKDIVEASKRGECAAKTTYYTYFGSIQKAREEAGLGKTVSRTRQGTGSRMRSG